MAAAPVAVKPTRRGAKTVTVKTVALKPPAAAGPALPMTIKKIRLDAGRLDFADLSIQPHFSAGILDLRGTILGLSSNPSSRAKVDLRGEVDQFSPVSINGEVNVLSAALYTDLTMSFRNIELSIFNPYSGRFAGYNIAKGKLTTDMHYKVVDRKLDAQHHIVIDQLEFGEKTASKDAVSLPVKLAVALLKDRNGVIDLPLPITGSLDDPKFRLAPIIWKVLLNILEKAVTAPFALLGALFGSGPDLQFVDFQPGSNDLSAAQSDKVKALVKALGDRPQLKLEVPIATVPDLDRPALVAAAFQSQIAEVQAGTPEGRQEGRRSRAVILRSARSGGEARCAHAALCARFWRRAKISRLRDGHQAKARTYDRKDRFFDHGVARSRCRRGGAADGAWPATCARAAAGAAHRYGDRSSTDFPGGQRQGQGEGRCRAAWSCRCVDGARVHN